MQFAKPSRTKNAKKLHRNQLISAQFFFHTHQMANQHIKAIQVCNLMRYKYKLMQGSSIYLWCLGGPAIRQRDNTLIGISSHVFPSSFTYNGKPVIIQGITNIHYFFDWISEITGLELPKC